MFEVNNKDTTTTPLANYSRNGLIQKNYEYGYRMNGEKAHFTKLMYPYHTTNSWHTIPPCPTTTELYMSFFS